MERDYQTYDDVKRSLQDLPMTWYPALIAAIVEAAYNKGVFVDLNGASNLIKQFEQNRPVLPAKEHRKATIIACQKAKKL